MRGIETTINKEHDMITAKERADAKTLPELINLAKSKGVSIGWAYKVYQSRLKKGK